MTEEGLAPTAPGMAGLPADTAPVVRQPASRRRTGGRVVVAGGLVALALAGTGGALGSVLSTAEAPDPGLSQVAPPTTTVAHPPTLHRQHESGDLEGEQD